MRSYRNHLDLDVKWVGSLRFEADNRAGLRQEIDAEIERGLSPMQGLLASLGAAVATNVVLLLEKVRSELRTLTLSIRGERNPEPPQFLRRVEMKFYVEGSVTEERVEQAVRTALERYCGVLHSLRRDLEIDFLVKVAP